MRSGPVAVALLLPALALALVGCGDERLSAAVTAKRTVRTAKATELTVAKHCRGPLANFLDSMESLNNSLAVGLSYDDYLTAVNHVRSAYAPIDAGRLPLLCLARVASPAEGALNTYIDAANAWGDCLATSSCDTESIEPQLQRKWALASDGLSEAQENLRNLP